MKEDVWRDEAACRRTDPELFFPTARGVMPTGATSICARCPVAFECVREAMTCERNLWDRHEEIRAGTRRRDRDRLMRSTGGDPDRAARLAVSKLVPV